jgi:hypothetical protein
MYHGSKHNYRANQQWCLEANFFSSVGENPPEKAKKKCTRLTVHVHLGKKKIGIKKKSTIMFSTSSFNLANKGSFGR